MADGMGAIPIEGGTAFRVWAPHADTVSVVGSFNDWDPAVNPLSAEGNGHWYGEVPGAHAGHEYKFQIRNWQNELLRIDPYARQVTSSVGNGVIYDHGAFDWQGDDFRLPSHDDLVIYEMHIGSFYRPDDSHVGTLELAMERFDHLDALGVDLIQLMPVAEFAGDFSWGYNPAHIFAVESAYGGPDAFKTFVREAHRRGIGVVLDVVYNHFGPSDLDLWQFDGWSENDKGGIYFYNDDRSQTPWGDSRPDYGREEVRRFIHDNAMAWLRDYRLDGLRFDMTPFISSVNGGEVDLPDGWSLMRWINTTVREQFPDCITIAEDMHDDPSITRTEEPGAGFHAQWDPAFVHPVREAVTADWDGDRSLESVWGSITSSFNDDAFQRVIFTESHDEVANGRARVPEEIDENDPTGWNARKRSTLGAALVFTAPGIPMLFQGQEFLEGGWFRDDVPLDWDQSKEFVGISRLYRDLIRLRRNGDGQSRGLRGRGVGLLVGDETAKVLAFHRWADGGPGDDVVVAVNLSAHPAVGLAVPFPRPGGWSLRLSSDAKVYCSDFGDGGIGALEVGGDSVAHVDLPAYSVLIYSQDQAG